MTSLILVGMALVFLSFVALLTAAEAAFTFLPRHDAEQAIVKSRGNSLRSILAQPVAHIRALRFWRVWFEMAAAVAVAVVMHSLLENVWLAGLAATGIMAVIGFVLVASRPVNSDAPTRAGGSLLGTTHQVPVLDPGPIPGWLVAIGSTVAPARPAATKHSSARKNSVNSWTGPRNPT
ncbi:cobalt ion transmembrane transporter protein [Arthrobacter sp. Hiyo8]|nr:cobalt ion transmembrane transporter protein [Arthrobacter sp. Hiyo8]